MKRVASILLWTTALGFLLGCEARISEQDLSFLAGQKKPLTYQAVAKRLGDTKPGNGPFYAYQIRGGNKTVEFWMSPPPPPDQISTSSIPVEIVAVVVRLEGSKPSIIWPGDMKGKDFDEAMAAIWSQKH